MNDEQPIDGSLANVDAQGLVEAPKVPEPSLPDNSGDSPLAGDKKPAKVTLADIISAIKERMTGGTVRVYTSFGGTVYLQATEPDLANVDAPCSGTRAAEWVMAATFRWFGVVLKKSQAQAVCMILAGGPTPILPGDKSDRELLAALDRSPVLATVVEYMSDSTRPPRIERQMVDLHADLSKFAEQRDLYWRNGKSFPGGPAILSRHLNALTSLLPRFGVKYETHRSSGTGATAILSKLHDATDAMPSVVASAAPSAPLSAESSTLAASLTPERHREAFRERQAQRHGESNSVPSSIPAPGEVRHDQMQ